MIIKDDWEKPRGKGNHLTAAEIAQIRVAFNCGRRPADIARELKCSSRVAAKYFAQFRGVPHKKSQRQRQPRPIDRSGQPVRARFYTSNFEL